MFESKLLISNGKNSCFVARSKVDIIMSTNRPYMWHSRHYTIIKHIRVPDFVPYLFLEITANTKISNLFRIKFEFGKKNVSSFAKTENPEKNSFRIALINTFLLFDSSKPLFVTYKLNHRGKTGKSFESKSYFVNFNIVTGELWPR